MDDTQLKSHLKSLGMGCFVQYYYRFSNWSLSNQEIAQILQDEMGYKERASSSRTSTARSIIKAGRAIDALDIISRSNAAPQVRVMAAEIADSLRRGRRTWYKVKGLAP